jgi:hypothetical protein
MSLRSEGMMVEICVDVVNGAVTDGLLGSLGGILGRSSVSWDATLNDVRVCSEWDTLDIDRVLDAIESWLAGDGVGSSAKLMVGDRTYTLAG